MPTSAWVEFEKLGKQFESIEGSQQDIMKARCPHNFNLEGHYCTKNGNCFAPAKYISRLDDLHSDCEKCWTEEPVSEEPVDEQEVKLPDEPFKFTSGISKEEE